jgi:hypothetical protein
MFTRPHNGASVISKEIFMKVKELLLELAEAHPEATVVLSTDAEGNSIRYVDEVTLNDVLDQGGWETEIADGYEGDKTLPAVCLWPVN